MARVSLIAKMTAKEGKRAELVEILREHVNVVESEPGTLVYALNLSTTEPEVVWFYELYADQDSLVAHGGSDAMKKASAAMRDLMAGRPELIFLEPVAGKRLPG